MLKPRYSRTDPSTSPQPLCTPEPPGSKTFPHLASKLTCSSNFLKTTRTAQELVDWFWRGWGPFSLAELLAATPILALRSAPGCQIAAKMWARPPKRRGAGPGHASFEPRCRGEGPRGGEVAVIFSFGTPHKWSL